MTGKKRKAVRSVRYIFLLLAAAFCYYLAVKSFFSLEKNDSVSICLTGNYPNRAMAEEILKDSREEENLTDICFYWDGGIRTAENPGLARKSQVTAVGLLGDASLYSWHCNALSLDDREGCILDKKTAVELFGSENCIGSTVKLGEKNYVVRKVVPWSQRVILSHPTEKEMVFTRVFVRPKNGESQEKAADRFMMSYGLFGTLVEDEWPETVCKIALLFCTAVWTVLFFQFLCVKQEKYVEQNEAGKHAVAYWLCSAGMLIAAGGLLYVIFRNVHVPADWLPDRWSDFGFWERKISEEREKLCWYLILPKTVPQAESMMQAMRVLGFSAGAFLLSLCLMS